MRQIVNRVMSLSYEIFNMDNVVVDIKGNPDFIQILNSYPNYVYQKKAFVKETLNRVKELGYEISNVDDITTDPKFIEIMNSYPDEETRGTKISVEYSVDVCFLAYLVKLLYEKNGRPFFSPDWERVKRVINNGTSGQTDFFDPDKSKMWINVFSALDNSIHLFTPEEFDSFADFFENYISFYGKMNNTKTVPFYSRWLREIAAMYTIYLNAMYEDFEEIATSLQKALEEGMGKKSRKRLLRYETDAVRNYLMTNIFMACDKKDKDKVIAMLCKYIAENPDEFVYERGISHDKRYRRYYCVIKEMLRWILEEAKFDFGNENLLKNFCDDNVDYKCKDANIRMLESVLVRKIMSFSEPRPGVTSQDKHDEKWLSFLISEEKDFEGKYTVTIPTKDSENVQKKTFKYSRTYKLVFSIERDRIDSMISYKDEAKICKRKYEEVVDSVVKLLRFFIMLIVISKAQSSTKNEWERPSKDDVLNSINRVMSKQGLLSLPTHTVNGFNEKTMMDFCIIKYIEESFDDED